ncbi:ABC transporter ATP-binding protein [Calidifontimicrobium sp. SYSU G02091]|uniref:oligopeptide/dipeptide ABC transporter ATP-binding protein n=1 Tax=Calidifontimicrobium sp. SYSU G02091 TaxID=2926421 RepID=UPI001F53BFA6|nr:ABC transporter ATP-binding protein [Calidifontimicrobium sp. SYSU G02091]MCI1191294.1 ABC transporter ATP-binding protein [Calidifontimicrobium sp. SYSU G02091]
MTETLAAAPLDAAAPAGAPLLRAERLGKRFKVDARRGAQLLAVDDVDLEVGAGESVGLVGESGCGKSTLVRLLARLLDPSEGRIVFDGEDLAAIPAARFARHPKRPAIQMVFQDPTDSLNPRYTARETIAEPLRLLAGLRRRDVDARVDEVAAQVGLPTELLDRFAHQLSGGQKARVGIARALAVRPRLLILDEPTAALDVSVQAVVLQLLERLRRELGLSYLFVSHDLNVVRLLTERVAVMYLGRIVEQGPSEAIFRAPRHPYTRALVSAIPGQGPRIRLAGEVSSPIDPPPQVCRFASRCPQAQDRCRREMPRLLPLAAPAGARQRLVACHFAA